MMKGEKVEDKYGGKKQRLAIEHVANVDDERVPAGIKKDSHCMGNVAVNKTKMMFGFSAARITPIAAPNNRR